MITVQLFGDSTQLGSGASKGCRPFQLLQKSLDECFGSGAVSVINSAVGGTTARDAISLRMDGDIVVANWGVNDCTKYPAAAYRGYLRQLSGVTLFQTPIPILHERYDTTAYAQVMREVAAERSLPVADAHAAVLEVPHWRAMLSDGFHHPNDAMYRVIVGVLYPEVMRQVHAALAVNSSCTRK